MRGESSRRPPRITISWRCARENRRGVSALPEAISTRFRARRQTGQVRTMCDPLCGASRGRRGAVDRRHVPGSSKTGGTNASVQQSGCARPHKHDPAASGAPAAPGPAPKASSPPAAPATPAPKQAGRASAATPRAAAATQAPPAPGPSAHVGQSRNKRIAIVAAIVIFAAFVCARVAYNVFFLDPVRPKLDAIQTNPGAAAPKAR